MTLILDKDDPLATKVQTRDGKKVRLLCVDLNHARCPIVAAVYDSMNKESVYAYASDGMFGYSKDKSDDDLINTPDPINLRERAWEIFEKRWSDLGCSPDLETFWLENMQDESFSIRLTSNVNALHKLSGILAGLEEGRGDDV